MGVGICVLSMWALMTGVWAYSDVAVVTASQHCGCWVVCVVASLSPIVHATCHMGCCSQ